VNKNAMKKGNNNFNNNNDNNQENGLIDGLFLFTECKKEKNPGRRRKRRVRFFYSQI
jgi:hypothetical protein